jgi:chorismate mutase
MGSGTKNNDDSKDLVEIRERINAVDEQIQALINERAQYAQQVGVAKGKMGSAVDYYRPEREAEVLRKIVSSSISGTRYARCRFTPLMKYSRRSKAVPPISA